MTKMHEDELEIDEHLVYKLLKGQCLQWADLPLKLILSSGTDNALFRLGKEYVVRLPRVDRATKNIAKEYEWVPKLNQHLKIDVSKALFKGKPSQDYPWDWLVLKWNEGVNPAFEQENEYGLLSKDLACFLNDLQAIKLKNGPFSRRGVSLKELNIETRKAIAQIEILSIKLCIRFLVHLMEESKKIPVAEPPG